MTRSNELKINLPDGSTTTCASYGKVKLRLENDNTLTLDKVYYIPSFTYNLISIGMLNKDYIVAFDQSKIDFTPRAPNSVGMTIHCSNNENIYILSADKTQVGYANAAATTDSKLWHERLGHRSLETIKAILSKDKLFPDNKLDEDKCEACILAKSRKQSAPRVAENRATRNLERIHMDLVGPITPMSISGYEYFLIVVDEFSRYTWTFPITKKSEVPNVFKNWITQIENLTKTKVMGIRSDGGSEFINQTLKTFYADSGINVQVSCPHNQYQNGIAESRVRLIKDMTRTALIHANLPKNLWWEAVAYQTTILNNVPPWNKKDNYPVTILFGKSPAAKRLKVFGCIAYVHRLDNDQKGWGTWSDKSRKGVFLGHPDNKKGYLVYIPGLNRWFEKPNVTFREQFFLDIPVQFQPRARNNNSPVQTHLPIQMNEYRSEIFPAGNYPTHCAQLIDQLKPIHRSADTDNEPPTSEDDSHPNEVEDDQEDQIETPTMTDDQK